MQFGKLNKQLQWNSAIVSAKNNIEYVIVPVKQDIKPFTNKSYEAFRNVIFYKDKSGKMQMTIMEVYSKKNESLEGKAQNISKVAFENMYLSGHQTVEHINASIIFYDPYYFIKSSFSLTDGSWAPEDFIKSLESLVSI